MPTGNADRRGTPPAAHPDRRKSAPFDRRRTPPSADSPRRRRTDFINRYRQPLIGLGMLGAAVPLARQTTSSQAERTRAQDPGANAASLLEAQARRSVAAGAAERDAEEQLAQRIADSREQAERARYVQAAVADHGISDELAGDIFDIAREEGLDPDVAIGLVRTESTFDERAVSGVGARGLTQVMPRTARSLIPGTRADQLFDRRTNLRLGFRYLDQLVDKYRGNIKLALTAYNRGPGTVDRVLRRGGNPDNGYAGKVLGS